MRTSSQLTKVDQCSRHPHANITQSNASITRAMAQKDVILRTLRGEQIPDIASEIDSILISRNCFWENREHKLTNLALYKARIERFLRWETHREHIFPDNMDTVIDFFGEEVEAEPDYFIRERNRVTVVKLTTSRFVDEKSDIQENEAYALGLVGEKLFPGCEITVQYLHLGDKQSDKNKKEQQAILRPYDDEKFQKISNLKFDEAAKTFFTLQHERETEVGCSAEDCANCSANALCHYEEPPISINVEKSVRPISEIRLTKAQHDVINYEEGIARINAGAGAGKTLVVAMRIVELLQKGYEPEDICLLTFTKAGAEEMTARVIQYCAGNGLLIDPARLTSTTFNAFCQNLITAYYEELGYSAPPRVIPEETKSGILNRLIDQFPHIPEWRYDISSAGGGFGKGPLWKVKKLFAEIKKEGYTREENPYADQLSPVSLDVLFQMYDEFDRTMMRRNFVEYDDQILKTFELLKVHPTLFEEIGYRHIIVDEFQDTDLPQINLLNQIIDTGSFKSFMAVGDDSQSIFAFRHTSPEYMINFGNYFGRYDDFALVENHRSASNIIEIANKINAMNENRVEKDLIPTKPATNGPFINGFYTQKQEYEWIADQIVRQIEAGREPSDIAVLMSDKNELTAMASILTDRGIPSILMNPIPFVSNSRVAALCAFYDSFENGTTKGLIDYQNALLHGALRGATARELEDLADAFGSEVRSDEHTINKFLEYANALDEEQADECYQEFLEKISFCQNAEELSEFFQDFALYGKDSKFKREGKYEGVCLTTVHSAKGLEWDVTYLSLSHFDKADYHKNPSKYRNNGEMDEVYRKWFVGTTRAREELIMTGQYTIKMTNRECIPNDFVTQAHDLLGRPYAFSQGQYWTVYNQEIESQKAATNAELSIAGIRKSQVLGSLGSRGDTSLINRYANAAPLQRQEEDLLTEDIEFA
jgi:DNA helicase-2/ATP-dependent DNA helicase PcrA